MNKYLHGCIYIPRRVSDTLQYLETTHTNDYVSCVFDRWLYLINLLRKADDLALEGLHFEGDGHGLDSGILEEE